MPPTVAIYAGSFDPPTKGHIYVIDEALSLFDKLIIAVGTNPSKTPLFTADERAYILREFFIMQVLTEKIQVITFDAEYLVDVAIRHHCTHLIRGVRNAKDCEEELGMAQINRTMANDRQNHDLHTVFIPTPAHLALVSSSLVKSLIGFNGWEKEISRYTWPLIVNKLKEKFNRP